MDGETVELAGLMIEDGEDWTDLLKGRSVEVPKPETFEATLAKLSRLG